MEFKAFKAFKGETVFKGILEPRVLKDHKEPLVLTEPQGHKVPRVSKEILEPQVLKDHKG